MKPVSRAERLEFIRELLIEGVPDRVVRQRLVAGIQLPLPDGRLIRVSAKVAAADLSEVGEAYRRLHDDPSVQEAEVAGVIARLRRIAVTAEKRGNYHAAIRANESLAKFVGMRSARWSKAAEPAPGPPGVEAPDDQWQRRATELQDLPDEDLARELSAARERAARAGLVVVGGGRG